MLTLYFSGTGNSAYAARLFSECMDWPCHSITETVDFSALITRSEVIAFIYPVYLSRVPRIMALFVKAHRADLRGKKLVILATQMEFSGDGARCFTDLLPKASYEVLYAEQIKMPNNVNNMGVFKQQTDQTIQALAQETRTHIEKICADIKAGVVFKRDFNRKARLLGLLQGVFSPFFQWLMRRGIRIGRDCKGCGLCVKHCPTQNLTLKNGRAKGGNTCTACYRCLNLCPKRAINLYFPWKVPWQYQGIQEEKNTTSA